MLRILIVDDEMIVRLGIKAIIPWAEHGCQIVGEASNGQEGVQMAKDFQPNLIFTDISMPEMDGLTMISEVKAFLPNCEFIILSCLNEIKYYKDAMILGAHDYILKSSVTQKEILEIIEAAKREINNSSEYLDDLKDDVSISNMLDRVFFGSDDRSMPAELEELIRGEKNFLLVGRVAEHGMDKARSRLFTSNIIETIKQIIKDVGHGYVYLNIEKYICILVSYSGKETEEEFYNDIFNRINNTSKQLFDVGVVFGACLCKLNSIIDMPEGYQSAKDAYENAVFWEKNFYYKSEGLDAIKHENVDECINKILHIHEFFDTHAIEEQLNQLAKMVVQVRGYTKKEIKKRYMDILYHIIEIANAERENYGFDILRDIDVQTLVFSAKSFKILTLRINALLEDLSRGLSEDVFLVRKDNVHDIKKFIANNISTKITLETLSNEVYLNPQYICRLFKKETGSNIIDYINIKKIEEAKKLLVLGESISTIIEKTGFSNESYFIKVFKRYENITPGVYCKMMLNNVEER